MIIARFLLCEAVVIFLVSLLVLLVCEPEFVELPTKYEKSSLFLHLRSFTLVILIKVTSRILLKHDSQIYLW